MASVPSLAEKRVFCEALDHAAEATGLRLTDPQRDAMYAHFGLMTEANRHFNLTRITSPIAAAVKHYADALSILAAPWLDLQRSLTVLDVGTGAGFPAVPLAIVRPDWQITAIDGTGKKVRFVAGVAERLCLANLDAQHVRASEYPGAAEFDLVLLRAVGAIDTSLRETAPLAAPDGTVVFYKTADLPARELELGNRRAARLGLIPLEPFDVTLPGEEEILHRRLLAYRRQVS
jgi:16S rRNA (guanine527-N7)-methyltransferase